MPDPRREWTTNFSGHESFPLRFAWLTKGYQRVCGDSSFFSKDDAMVELGVGKNMVSSIRHWGLACQAWEDVPGSRGKEVTPTEFGQRLLTEWDEYLEHPGTYWLLHWQVATNPCKATTWELVFNRPSARFSQEQLLEELFEFAAMQGNRKASRASLKRDIEVFKRSYLRPATKKGEFLEDEIDCPFKQLGLLRVTDMKNEFELVVGDRPSLPNDILAFCLLDHVGHSHGEGEKTRSAEDLLYGWNSPGRIFRLSEGALMQRLHLLGDQFPDHYLLDETAGLRQFVIRSEAPNPHDALDHYYTSMTELAHA